MSSWAQPAKRKMMPHGFTAAVVGEVVTAPEVLTKNPCEWPKVGCKVAVRHNEDQTSVVLVVAVGPVAEFVRKQKLGATVMVAGHLKFATGSLELFALEAKSAVQQPRMMTLGDIIGGMGMPPMEDDE